MLPGHKTPICKSKLLGVEKSVTEFVDLADQTWNDSASVGAEEAGTGTRHTHAHFSTCHVNKSVRPGLGARWTQWHPHAEQLLW